MTAPRKITHKIGEWSWDADRLFSKIESTDNPNDCYTWKGNKNKHVNLFGAYKNNLNQMNSANRLIYMTVNKEDISDYAVRMSCMNKHCSNERHMYLELNRKQGLSPVMQRLRK